MTRHTPTLALAEQLYNADAALSAADIAFLRSMPASTEPPSSGTREQRQRAEDLPWGLVREGRRTDLGDWVVAMSDRVASLEAARTAARDDLDKARQEVGDLRPIADAYTHMVTRALRAEQERDGLRLMLAIEQDGDAALGRLEGVVRRRLGATFCLVWSPTWRAWYPYLGGDPLCDANKSALGGFPSRAEALHAAAAVAAQIGAEAPLKLDDDVQTMKGTREELEAVQLQRNQQQAALIARATESNQ